LYEATAGKWHYTYCFGLFQQHSIHKFINVRFVEMLSVIAGKWCRTQCAW